MRLQRRDVLSLGTAVAAASAVAACGAGESAETETTESASPSDSATPTPEWSTATASGSGQLALLSALLPTEDEQNQYANNVLSGYLAGSNYTMATTYTTADKLPDQIMTGLAGGNLADVVMPEQGWVPSLMRRNALAPMPNSLTNELEIDQRLLSGCFWDGRLYALPYAMDLMVVGYRADLLNDAGITQPPQTLDELREMARELTTDDRSGFDVFSPGLMKSWVNLIGCFGGSLYRDDGSIAFNDGTGADALDFIIQLVNEGISDPSTIPATGDKRLFTQDKAVMAPMGSQLWPEVQEAGLQNDDQLQFFALPPAEKGDDASVLQTGTLLSVSRQSQYQEVAFGLCHYALQSQPLISTLSMISAVPARSDIVSGSLLESNRIMQAGLDNAEYANFYLGGGPTWLDLRPVVEGQLMAAIQGRQSADTTIGNLAQVVSNSQAAG